MSIDAITLELINDCLIRISAGDACAAFDLASAFISHMDAKNVDVNLAIIEALATVAKLQGCSEAADFLDGQWPDLQGILSKRWRRAGFT